MITRFTKSPEYLRKALFTLLILFSLSISTCFARVKKAQYLVDSKDEKAPALLSTSPLIDQVIAEDSSVAKKLKQVETAAAQDLAQTEKVVAKISRETELKQRELARKEADNAEKIRKDFEAAMQQLKTGFEDSLKKLSQDMKTQREAVVAEGKTKQTETIQIAENAAKKQITQATLNVMSRYLEKKQAELAHTTMNKATIKPGVFITADDSADIAEWKTSKKNELSQNLGYIEQIVQDDPDLLASLQTKKNFLDQAITNTQYTGDDYYNAVMQELRPLTMLRSTQESADALISKALETTAMTDGQRQQIRLLVIYELPELIQEVLASKGEISTETLNLICMRAINQVKQRPVQTRNELLQQQLEELKNKLAEINEKIVIKDINISRAQQENASLNSNIQEQIATVTKLQQTIGELTQEKLKVEIAAERTRQELDHAKLEKKALESLQAELASMRKQLEQESQKYLQLTILLEQTKQTLTSTSLSDKEKSEKLKTLDEHLKKTKDELLKAQQDAAKLRDIELELQALKTTFEKTQKEKDASMQKLSDSNRTIEQLQKDLISQKKSFDTKDAELKKERAALDEEKADLTKRSADVDAIKTKIAEKTKLEKKSADPAEKENLKKELKSLNDDLIKKEAAVDKATKKLKIKIADLEKKNKQLAAEANKRKATTKKLQEQLSAQQDKETEYKAKIEKLTHQLDILKGRLRKPLQKAREDQFIEKMDSGEVTFDDKSKKNYSDVSTLKEDVFGPENTDFKLEIEK